MKTLPRLYRVSLLGLLLTASGLTTAGCVGPEIALSAGLNAVSANSATFSKGELISATRSPLVQTHEAVKRAFVALGLTPRNERLRDTSAYVMAVSLDDRDITVRLSSVAPSVTSISVKAGFWGDAALSRLVQDQIDIELKIAAIAPESAK